MAAYEKVPATAIDTLRMLAVDAVQKANSGHPGTPMGAAELTLTLWANFLRFDPRDPHWRDRDRFVLSAGHASMLLYGLLHLYGYGCTLEDLKKFRQLGSPTAGHPEFGHLPGVETTTGPLGQGIGNAVGLALGQALLAGKLNGGGGFQPVQGRVWCLAGDGCMMEGVGYEAASLAGHLKLHNLCVIYDKNDITIDGHISLAFSEDVAKRYEAFGWTVLKADAYDQGALCQAYAHAAAATDKPTLIIARSTIGKGAATLEGTAKTHGAALGEKEVEATKKKLGWPLEPFHIPAEAKAFFEKSAAGKTAQHAAWSKDRAAWAAANPGLAEEEERLWAQSLPEGFEKELALGMAKDKAASRKHSEKAIQALAKLAPWLIGGSADLAESNNTHIKDGGAVGKDAQGRFIGRNIAFGVREHGMAALCNGLALHGAWRPYCATFLQFADYMRPSIRLAALMQAKTIFVMTHDSVLLGEDGPTHQPVEHLGALRLIPGLTLWRPADGLETAMAWSWALSQAQGPSLLALTRQGLPLIDYPSGFDPAQVWRGGYVLREDPSADLSLVATGSELGLAVEAAKVLAGHGLKARIVSLPSACVFGRQDPKYKEETLGSRPRVLIEAGSTAYWPSVVGSQALVLGVDSFGASGKLEDLARHFGLTPELVAGKVQAWMGAKANAAV